jgi:glutaredoxin
MDVVIYCKDGCADSLAMREYLQSIGIDYRLRTVDGDAGARTEWEDIDGQILPLLVIDKSRIVRGMDRARVDQMVGWIGC